MIKSNSSFSCEEVSAGTLVIRLDGEIDHHGATGLRSDIDGVIFAQRPKKVILDLSQISFMDSSGLGLIMGRYALVSELGGHLTLRSPNAAVMKIIRLSGLEKLIKIEKEEK